MFGTDGVRGTPGRPPLDARTLARLGAAAARAIGPRGATFLAARDTRESGAWIEGHLARGVAHANAKLVSAGVLPTPAAAFLVSTGGFDGGVVISASHNPFPDNGIKVLSADGGKASPALEAEIESLVLDESWDVTAVERAADEPRDLSGEYLAHAAGVLADCASVPSLRIAADCANGAMSRAAPEVLRRLGFDVVALNVEPDGRNINRGCGSTHPEGLRRAVVDRGCQIGLAFDGDGDRVILVDHHGAVVDGDAMLFICARYLHERGRLPGNAVVATVMSNVGLEVGLRAAGVAVHRCPVGDRQVRAAMVAHGVVLGGEQSGHLIFSELLPTGDGLLTALSVIKVIAETGRSLADLRQELDIFPQVLINVPVRAKPDLASEPRIAATIRRAERKLGGAGRVLVRYSGTEPLLRVMVEGPEEGAVRQLAADVAAAAREALG